MHPLRVGIYGGTFDPIHFGHLNLAIALREKYHLREVWFIPNYINPHKQGGTFASPSDRLAMVQKAIVDIEGFQVLDLEANRQGPSYMVETLHTLLYEEEKVKNRREFFLLLGSDSLPSFHLWHHVDDIVHLIPLLIGCRVGQKNNLSGEASQKVVESVEKGICEIPLLDISATEIRERLKHNQYCGHLVPETVLTIIHQRQLYGIT